MIKLRSLAACAALLLFAACATSVSGAWRPDPAANMTPAAVMAGKGCSPIPNDQSANINRTGGWSSKAPAGTVMPSCSGGTPFYCMAPPCGKMTVGALPPASAAGQERHMVFDIVGPGTVLACAEAVEQFGWSRGPAGLDCQPVPFTAAAGEVKRVVLPVKVPGAGTSPAIQLVFQTQPDAKEPVTIGQVGPAEPTS